MGAAVEVGGLVVFFIGVVTALVKIVGPRFDAIEKGQENLHGDLADLRSENAEQHREGRELQRAVEDKLDRHLTVDHPKMAELLARIDERQRIMFGDDL